MDEDEIVVAFHPLAESEALESYQWYAKRNIDVAEAFQCELERARQLLLRAPHAWPEHIYGTHKLVLKHFPFNVIFRFRGNRVEIIAIAHQRRRPGYWGQRVR